MVRAHMPASDSENGLHLQKRPTYSPRRLLIWITLASSHHRFRYGVRRLVGDLPVAIARHNVLKTATEKAVGDSTPAWPPVGRVLARTRRCEALNWWQMETHQRLLQDQRSERCSTLSLVPCRTGVGQPPRRLRHKKGATAKPVSPFLGLTL